MASFILLVAGKNEPPPLMLVLLLPARSEDPPQNSGSTPAIALITFPEAARVARSFPLSNVGITFSQFFGNSRDCNLFSNSLFSGFDFAQVANSLSHCAFIAAPRSKTLRECFKTGSGTSKDLSGSRPSAILVAAISSAPSADPCDSAVPWAFGAGHAITVLRRIKEGLLFSL